MAGTNGGDGRKERRAGTDGRDGGQGRREGTPPTLPLAPRAFSRGVDGGGEAANEGVDPAREAGCVCGAMVVCRKAGDAAHGGVRAGDRARACVRRSPGTPLHPAPDTDGNGESLPRHRRRQGEGAGRVRVSGQGPLLLESRHSHTHTHTHTHLRSSWRKAGRNPGRWSNESHSSVRNAAIASPCAPSRRQHERVPSPRLCPAHQQPPCGNHRRRAAIAAAVRRLPPCGNHGLG